jgi:hypothetical protein
MHPAEPASDRHRFTFFVVPMAGTSLVIAAENPRPTNIFANRLASRGTPRDPLRL